MARPLIFYFSGIFFHRMTRNLFGDFLLRRLLTDFRGGDLFGRCRYPLREWNMSHRFHRFAQIFCGSFFVTQISQMTQIFLFFWDFFSSDDTEFIRRFLAKAITHGFSRRRPVRSFQIPPESRTCPTDFTALHRLSLLQFHSLPSHFSFLICLSFLISHLSFLIFNVFLICHLFVFLISHLSFLIFFSCQKIEKNEQNIKRNLHYFFYFCREILNL